MKKTFFKWAWRTLMTLTCLLTTTSAWADTWTVAGEPENFFGTRWDPSNTANDMTNVNGNDYILFKNVAYSGSISFKVCKNHDWSEAYPSDNYVLICPEGTQGVLFRFNSDTKSVEAKALPAFTVAGNNTALFGSNTWDPSNTANDMTSTNGITYTWSKENVELSAGTVEFKVCENHGWDTAYPSSNYKLNIPSNGNYNVTITFNSDTKEVTGTLTPLFVTAPVFSLAAGTYDCNQVVTITTTGTGTIYYTTDGSDPTNSETRIAYTGSVSVAGEGEHVIKAVAVAGDKVSEVVTATYVIKYQNIYVFGSVGKSHAWVYDYTNPELVTSDGINYSGVVNVLTMPDYTDRGGNAGLFMLTTGFGTNWDSTKPYMIGTTADGQFWIDGSHNYLGEWVAAKPAGESESGWTIIPSNGNGTPYEFFYNRQTNQFMLAAFDGPTIYVYDYTRPYIYVEDKDGTPFDGVQPGNPIQILDENVGGHSGLSTAADGSGDGTGPLGWYKFSVPSNNYPFTFQFHHNGDKTVIDSDLYTDNAGDVYYYWDGEHYQPIAKANVNNLRRIVAHVRVQGTTVPTCDISL